MASFFEDNDDLRFYFDEGVDWAALAEVTEYGFRTADGFKTGAEAQVFYREVAELDRHPRRRGDRAARRRRSTVRAPTSKAARRVDRPGDGGRLSTPCAAPSCRSSASRASSAGSTRRSSSTSSPAR